MHKTRNTNSDKLFLKIISKEKSVLTMKKSSKKPTIAKVVFMRVAKGLKNLILSNEKKEYLRWKNFIA